MKLHQTRGQGQLPYPQLSMKGLGRRYQLFLLLAGWTLYGLIYLGFGLVSVAWQVWALYAIYGIYYGLAEDVTRTLVADLAPANRRGMAYGALNATIGPTAFPASFIAGILWQGVGPWSGFGPQGPFVFRAGMVFATSIMIAVWLPQKNSPTL